MSNDFQICLRCNTIVPLGNETCTQCHMSFEPVIGAEHYLNNLSPIDDGLYLLDGRLIGERYKIAGFLGKGRRGKVYLAKDLQHSKQVAVRVQVVDPGEYDSRAFPNACHPYQRIDDISHVIQILDFQLVPWDGAKLLVISMEYADGGTFRSWLEANRNKLQIRLTTGLELFVQICKGLTSLHQAGIVYSNISPENFLFVKNRLKVADFYPLLNRAAEMEDNGNFIFKLHQGAPIYMSPEQFIESDIEKIDKRSDIYSLGIILFELIDPQGQPPFFGDYNRLRDLHLEVPPTIDPEVDEKLKAIINRCLSKDPGGRYQAIDDLITDLALHSQNESVTTQYQGTDDKQKITSLGNLWDRARHCYTEGDFKETTIIVEEILSVDPNHDSAQKLKAELQHRFLQTQRIYDEIALNLETNLDAAVILLKEATTLYPNHPSGYEIQIKMEYRTSCYCRYMEEGNYALQRAQWETALTCFRSASEMNPGDHNLKSLIETLSVIETLRKHINTALQQRDFKRALHLAHLVDIETEEIFPDLSS